MPLQINIKIVYADHYARVFVGELLTHTCMCLYVFRIAINARKLCTKDLV